MNATLLDAVKLAAMYCNINYSANTLTDDPVTARLVDGINAAYLSVARNKCRLTYSQPITVTGNRFAVGGCLKQFIRLVGAEDKNGVKIEARMIDGETVYFPHVKSGEAILVYNYLPTALRLGDQQFLLDERRVESRIYAYYAAAEFFSVEKKYTDAAVWQARYNAAFESLGDPGRSITMPVRRWR